MGTGLSQSKMKKGWNFTSWSGPPPPSEKCETYTYFFSNMNWQMFWSTKSLIWGSPANRKFGGMPKLEIFSTRTFSYPNNCYSFTMCKAHACISLAITATHRCLWRLCRLDAGTTRGCLLKIFSTRLEKNALRDKTSNQQFLCFSVIVK